MTTPSERITFTINLPPSGLRRNRLARDHGYRARLTREYAEQVWCAGNADGIWSIFSADNSASFTHYKAFVGSCQRPWVRAKVHYRWHSTHQMDEDNVIGSMKAALDVLGTRGARPLGIIVDDRDATITAEWVRERVRSKERVEIIVERLA